LVIAPLYGKVARMWHRPRQQIEDWLFGTPRDGQLTSRLRLPLQFLYALLRDLLGGQLNLHAMGLVYATLLAIVPLLAFSFAILRVFGVHRELEPVIFEFFRPMGDAAGSLTRQVMDFAENVRAGLVGSVGLALLVWTLIGTLKKVEDSLNFVWRVSQARSFGRRLAEYIGLLVIGPLLLGTVIGLSQLALGESSRVGLHSVLLISAPCLIMTALFTMVYLLAPNTRVRWWAALSGGFAAGVLWTVVGQLFTAFVLLSARMTVVYAGLAIVIATLVWTYLGWLILLLGAQLSFYVQNPSYLRIGMVEPRLSNNDMEQLTLSIMYLVGQRHRQGDRRWSVDSLATQLHLPGIVVARSTDALETAGLLLTTEDGRLAPARELADIHLVDVLSVARAYTRGVRPLPWSPPTAVSILCGELDGGWRAQCGARTLGELLES
jgi:membrane protein